MPAMLCIAFVVSSCQKDDLEEAAGANAALLQGEWKFMDMNSKSVVEIEEVEGSDSEKTVSNTNYNTTDNKGTVKFNGKQITATDIEYSIDAIIYAKYYVNNMFVTDLESPFAITLPKTSSISEFELVGTDSIYFSSGTVFGVGAGGQGQATIPSGSKYKIEGNKLIMTTKIAITDKDTIPGSPVTIVTSKTNGEAKMTFQKL